MQDHSYVERAIDDTVETIMDKWNDGIVARITTELTAQGWTPEHFHKLYDQGDRFWSNEAERMTYEQRFIGLQMSYYAEIASKTAARLLSPA